MYRDFLYLDIERIQSIIAQLEKGLLEQVIEGKTSNLEGKASVTAGVLASLLPVGVEGGVNRQYEIQATKVLHDYAFNIALDDLKKEQLCLELQENLERDNLLLPDGTFILAQGSLSVTDFGLLKGLAENERFLNSIFDKNPVPINPKSGQAKQQKYKRKGEQPIKQMWTLVDCFMGDAIHVKLSYSESILLVGPVLREYLRERTRDLIFKYGGKPRDGWKMLAQINQVTTQFNKLTALLEMTANLPNLSEMNIQGLTDVVNPIIDVINVFQEAIASVSYPAISVTPIAIYRELENVS
jgi:hypothetical protein